jgi:hypothetical protein
VTRIGRQSIFGPAARWAIAFAMNRLVSWYRQGKSVQRLTAFRSRRHMAKRNHAVLRKRARETRLTWNG